MEESKISGMLLQVALAGQSLRFEDVVGEAGVLLAGYVQVSDVQVG